MIAYNADAQVFTCPRCKAPAETLVRTTHAANGERRPSTIYCDRCRPEPVRKESAP